MSTGFQNMLRRYERSLLYILDLLYLLTGTVFKDWTSKTVRSRTCAAHRQIVIFKNPSRTAQMLFSRVCELRRTSWGQHETPQPSMYTHSNAYGAQGYSMYIPVSKIQVASQV